MGPRLQIKKTYILVPDLDCPIDGPIFLGSVLSHPQKPYETLNGDHQQDLEPVKIHKSQKDDWSINEENLNNVEVGIFAQLLSLLVGAGGDLNTSFSRSDIVGLSAKRIATEFMDTPSAAYLEKCLNASNIQIQPRRITPCWIVTGRKLAYGVSTEQIATRGRGVAGQVSVNTAALGAPVEPGVKGSINHSAKKSLSFGGSTDIVLAYRVRRILYGKKTGLSSKEYGKHTSLSQTTKPVINENELENTDVSGTNDESDDEYNDGEVDDDEDEEENEDIQVYGLEESDFGITQLGVDAMLECGTDSDGEECALVTSIRFHE